MTARQHLYKKPGAVDWAATASRRLAGAIATLKAAEHALELSGYKGAARGVHQANERVKDWLKKVELELAMAARRSA